MRRLVLIATIALLIGSSQQLLSQTQKRPAPQQVVTEKTLSQGDINQVKASVFIGSLRVYTDSPDAVRVKAVRSAEGGSADQRDRWLKQTRVLIQQKGNTVEIKDIVPDDLNQDARPEEGKEEGHDFQPRLDIEIHMPADTALSASSLVGSVEVTGRVGDMDLRSTAGSIRLKRLHCSGKQTDIHADAGNVEMGLRSLLREQLKVEVAAGNVRFNLPEQARATVEMETTAGRLKAPAKLASLRHEKRLIGETLSGKVNGGGTKVRVQVAAGNIQITPEGETEEDSEEQVSEEKRISEEKEVRDDPDEEAEESEADESEMEPPDVEEPDMDAPDVEARESDEPDVDDPDMEEADDEEEMEARRDADEEAARARGVDEAELQREIRMEVQEAIHNALQAIEQALAELERIQEEVARALEEVSRLLEELPTQWEDRHGALRDLEDMPPDIGEAHEEALREHERARHERDEARDTIRKSRRQLKREKPAASPESVY